MDITQFNTQYSGDYARPNLFEVSIAQMDTKMVIKTASLPATTVGVVEVPYQNRKMKVPGDRTFADWTATVINDEGYMTRKAFLQWQAQIVGFKDFKTNYSVGSAHRPILIQPLKRSGGNTSHKVEIYGWPSEIGAIDLSWETADTIQEYTVTFAVSWDDGAKAAIEAETGTLAALKP